MLTDEQLVDLERWAADDLRGDEQREVWALVDELRERRRRDLDVAEREALERARDWVPREDHAAQSALSKLLGDGEVGR